MKKITLILTAVIFGLGLQKANAQEKENAVMRADQTTIDLGTIKETTIEINESIKETIKETIDLGTIKEGKGKGVVTFTIKNTGKKVTRLWRINPICPCTNVQSDKEIVEPGKTLTITVSYTFGIGNFNKLIELSFSNDERIHLYIKAKVIAEND